MSLYFIFVYIHILSAILWVGYTLYWFLVIPPLKNEFNRKVGNNLINQIDYSEWPPGSITGPLRLTFSGLGLICIATLIASGLVLLYLRGFTLHEFSSGHIFMNSLGLLGIGKLSLVAIMLFVEFFVRERSVKQARLVFLMTLLIVGLSVLLVR